MLAAHDLELPAPVHCTGVNRSRQVPATRPKLAGGNGLGQPERSVVGEQVGVGRRTIGF